MRILGREYILWIEKQRHYSVSKRLRITSTGLDTTSEVVLSRVGVSTMAVVGANPRCCCKRLNNVNVLVVVPLGILCIGRHLGQFG